MTFEKENIGYFIAFMVVGAILGSAIGTMLAGFFPALAVIKKNLTGPIGFNLEIISFSIRLSLSACVGLIGGIFIFRKV
jgi:hypothetical protein